MGGDGASLDGELGKQVWKMLQDEDVLDALTTAELKQVVDILQRVHDRKYGEQ